MAKAKELNETIFELIERKQVCYAVEVSNIIPDDGKTKIKVFQKNCIGGYNGGANQ